MENLDNMNKQSSGNLKFSTVAPERRENSNYKINNSSNDLPRGTLLKVRQQNHGQVLVLGLATVLQHKTRKNTD